MNSRKFIHLTGSSLAMLLLNSGLLMAVILACGCSPAVPSPDQPPNIVLILADDLGQHQVGSYGNPFYQTPYIDQLASQGMRFTNAYAQTVCSPSRAALMTGKYPARLHLTDYIAGNDPRDRRLLTPRWRKYLPLEETTLAEALSEQGYVTGHFGKWHLNRDKEYQPGRPGDPGSQGFDEVLTTLKPESDADPLRDAHHVHLITDRSIQFIRDHREGPFFCYVTHNSIHRPQMEDPELIARYASRPGADEEKNKPVAAAMMEVLDRSVGRILEALEGLSLVDNTIVIFYSDNGAFGDPEVLKPLRGSKANLYEGGIRVPLIVRWPGKVQPGSVSSTICTDIDLFPTLIEATSAAPVSEKLDGLSLLPVLTGTGDIQREAIYWHYPHYHHRGINPAGAIRMGDFKLIEWFEKSIDGADTEGALELFNLREDPGEQNNIAGEMPDLALRLHRQLQEWRTSIGAQMMTKNK